MKTSRVIDYAIYITAGFTLCALMFIPLVLGVDMKAYEWRMFTVLSMFVAVSWLAYELRSWRKKPQLWILLAFVAFASALSGWWLHHIHYTGSTILVSIPACFIVVALEAAFRALMSEEPKN